MPEQCTEIIIAQYAPAAHVPLIKSPSLRVPPPVVLPPDIHPLPDSVTDYFVYPFTLEPHIITLESSRRNTIAAHASRREAYLRHRNDEKERRKRDALRRIAPGFEPQGSVLVPTRTASSGSEPQTTDSVTPGHRHTKSVMDDLVDQLAALDSDETKKLQR
ncbi:hypothetical protein H0H92_008480 [Tricholoma furcatifolium]|nr:hypothetical protein H0H92_008480 [Tricholoma furcatifolium]